MFQLIFPKITLLFILLPLEMISSRKITVMVSQSEPFAIFKNENPKFKGLDTTIVENFGRKYHFQIEYIKANESLKEVFSSENRTEIFFESIKDL